MNLFSGLLELEARKSIKILDTGRNSRGTKNKPYLIHSIHGLWQKKKFFLIHLQTKGRTKKSKNKEQKKIPILYMKILRLKESPCFPQLAKLGFEFSVFWPSIILF